MTVRGDVRELDDCRDWLERIEGLGELRSVRGASWDREIGAASEINYRSANPAALLFDDIVDYPSGYRVLTGSMANARRLGITLRLGDDCTDSQLVAELADLPGRWMEEAEKFQPRVVDSGPVLENVHGPEAVDLLSFPVPHWHEGDGGRYAGTGCAVLTRNPDTGRVNAGAYRMQVQDGGRSASVNIESGKHGAMDVRAWFAKEGRAPIAATLGGDPALVIASGTEVSASVSELAYVGAIRRRPLDVVLGQTTGLPIPAAAEIAVEGWLYPDRTRPEGPFGEWTGYYSGGADPVLTMEIERVYHRDDPIMLGAPPGKPPHDYSYMRSVMKSAMIQSALTRSGLPGLVGVWAHEVGGGRQLIVVAVDQKYGGHARQAAYLASQHPSAAYMNKLVIVVDHDVNPRDLNDVMWAVCTRMDPAEDIEVMRQTWGSRVDPLREPGALPINSRAIIDACRPWARRDSFPKVAESSRELLAGVAARWPELRTGVA